MRGIVSVLLTAFLLLAGAALTSGPVLAQPAGLDAGKDCQVIRTCNFRSGGAYRGCISAYSCRQCQFVSASCTIDGTRKICRRLRCSWGAATS
ncbi:MAG: hypothetical protein NW223_02050 [Hyphomicrobiaceae bacterium]|nr:hypothetical protein [Hyphomicrobiaceae bacterium]